MSRQKRVLTHLSNQYTIEHPKGNILVFKKLSTFKRHLLNAAEQLFSVAASVK
jgi:hypothetical protein